MKTFKYKKHKNCHFMVASYIGNPDAIYIEIRNKSCESITDCTTFIRYAMYEPKTTTIKNLELVKFLKELKIVTRIISKIPYGNFSDSLYFCKINTDKLREYSKEWNYNYA